MDMFASTFALLIAIVLAASACHKLVARDRLAASAARLTGVPSALGAPLSFAAASVEVLAGIAILLPGGQTLGASLAFTLWAIYAILLYRRRAQPDFDCGCDFGSPKVHHRQRTYVRASMLALLALIPIASQRTVQIELRTLLPALGFFGLYLTFTQLAALPPLKRSSLS